MLSAIKGILTSKKWIMVIIGSAAVGIMQHFGVPQEIIVAIAGLFGVGVAGQGMADFGKNVPK
jgi:hypothetical protein